MKDQRRTSSQLTIQSSHQNPKKQILETLIGLIGRLKRKQGRYVPNRRKAK